MFLDHRSVLYILVTTCLVWGKGSASVAAVDVRGKLVVVTGASSGIGAATAEALGAAGARVVLMARTQAALDSVADGVRRRGGEAHVIAVDVGDSAAAFAAAEQVLAEAGVPDVIVNNAGAGRFLFIDETEPEEFEQMARVPYFAAFFVTKAFLPAMLERGSGQIVVVNTPASLFAWPGALGYTAARFALRGFTEALRADLRGSGLGVSSVTPAKVSTPYFERNPGAEARIPRISKITPTITPERTAQAIVRAIERESRDVYIPFALKLNVIQARLTPGFISWLLARTGAKRSTIAK